MFGGFLSELDDDPFFGGHMRSMQHMNSMMNSLFADPFGMMGGMGMGRRAIGNGRNSHDLMPFGGFGFPDMEHMFRNIQDMSPADAHCHSYSSSTVMTMSSGPDGRPQVYQASQSTVTAPGGIKETKKSVCDSRTGTKKLAIGHHIGDRAHVLEREHNMHSGEQEERQEFINLDEDDAEQFNREWETRTRGPINAITGGPSHRSRRHRELPALPSSNATRFYDAEILRKCSQNSEIPDSHHVSSESRRSAHRHKPKVTKFLKKKTSGTSVSHSNSN